MALKTRLKSGEITPAKLAEMTSKERNDYFSKFLDDKTATSVNTLYESKMLLLDQQKGLVSWLKTITGMKPETKRDLIERVNRMKEPLLNPAQEEEFLADLAAQRLGVGVTLDEAKTISQLSKSYQDALKNVHESLPDGASERIDAGAARVEFDNYVAELKRDANRSTLADLRADPLRELGGKFSDIGGLAKSIKASMDNSFVFRQGFKAMIAHPAQWANNAGNSFRLIARQLGQKGTSDDVVNALKAELYGRKNALNGKYGKMKLDLGVVEEAYPTSLPERIPLLGRVFKASEAAFKGTAYRLRADIADQLVAHAEKAGRDTSDPELLKSIGTYVNSLTGRGDLGRVEGFAKAFNNLFFSPRFFKSNLDFLTAHAFDRAMDPLLKRRARMNLLKAIAAVGSGLAVAKAINPDSVDFDPRSSNFGKIKVGNTRVDVTAGMSSILTLAARELSQSSKSSTSGRVTELDSGSYAGPTTMSVFGDFLQNKFAPFPRTVLGLRKGENFDGEPMDLSSVEGIKNTAVDLLAPIPVTNTIELAKDPDSIGPILGTMLDGLGFGTNTYK